MGHLLILLDPILKVHVIKLIFLKNEIVLIDFGHFWLCNLLGFYFWRCPRRKPKVLDFWIHWLIYFNMIYLQCIDRNVHFDYQYDYQFLFSKPLKRVSTIFYQIFIFSSSDRPLKTMKNVFYFILKALFVLEIFRFS